MRRPVYFLVCISPATLALQNKGSGRLPPRVVPEVAAGRHNFFALPLRFFQNIACATKTAGL